MKLKTIPIIPKPKEGDTKIERRFAWWPHQVEDKLIWLESYEVHYIFTRRNRVAIVGYRMFDIMCGGWDETGKKLIYRKPGLPDFKNIPPPPKR